MATEDSTTTPPPEQPPTIDWSTAPGQLRDAHDAARKDAQAARGERDALQREVAMLRAGVDSEHPAYSYFNAGYKGELAPDDIKAEWAKITGNQTTTPPAEGQAPAQPSVPTEVADQLQALQDARSKLTGGATAPGTEPTPDPMDTALTTFHEARKGGDNQQQAMRKAFQVMFNAAAAGDQRIAFDSSEAQMDAWKREHGEDVW